MGDESETSVTSCGPRHPEWETSVGDKGETSVNSCGPRNPEWETSVGERCKLMRPKEPRVGDKRETSVNSCGPRHPEWETRGRQVITHVAQGLQSGGQVWETSVGDKWGTSGRQV